MHSPAPTIKGGRVVVGADGAEVVLAATGVALAYARDAGSRQAILADFSLDLAAGEIIAVLGPSGAGKSSLLRVLAGLQTPSAGEVRVGGQVLEGAHPRMSFVFQDPCLLPWLNVEANVGFGLDFRNQPVITGTEKNRRVQEALAEVDLADATRAFPTELSGGMKQRVALARAIARQPEILLLDEPFSALDEITRGEMQGLLQTLVARHRTAAVLVTHDIDEALILADRVLLIGGRPARQMGEWHMALGHPRDEASSEIVDTRVEIVRAMREARAMLASARHATI